MKGLLRLGFRLLSAVAPRRAATIGARFWFSVRRPPISDEVKKFLGTGEPFETSVGGTPVAAWRWGQGEPVLLMHGWGGHAAQLQAFRSASAPAGAGSPGAPTSMHATPEPDREGVLDRTRIALREIALKHGLAEPQAARWAGEIDRELRFRMLHGAQETSNDND